MEEIKFPYYGSFTAKRSGYTWHYEVYEDGGVSYMERYGYAPITRRSTQDRRYKVVCGGDRSVTYTAMPTKECLADIEKKLGRRTDGYQWITEEDIKEDENLLKKIPLDDSYRMMKKTKLIVRNGRHQTRKVYRHIPTGDLYYNDHGWRMTYIKYCYNVETNERGEWF